MYEIHCPAIAITQGLNLWSYYIILHLIVSAMSPNWVFKGKDAKVETGCSVIPSRQIMIENKNHLDKMKVFSWNYGTHTHAHVHRKKAWVVAQNRCYSSEQGSLQFQSGTDCGSKKTFDVWSICEALGVRLMTGDQTVTGWGVWKVFSGIFIWLAYDSFVFEIMTLSL